jgi:hypothetical protein
LPDEKIDAVLLELQAGRERDLDAERRNAATSSALLSAISKLEAAIKSSSIYSKNEPATERASMGTLFTVVGALAAIGGFALGTVVSDVSEITTAMIKDTDRERIYAAANSEQEARLRFLEAAVHGRVSHESQ